ncbi:MAG: PKD domain-containing protein, partial [Sphingobacteriales bacterium]
MGGQGDAFALDMIGSCPVTPPVADFTASTTTLCTGSTVSFTDTSTNIPFIWNWTFQGGTPPTSTAQNPTVQYNAPGTYQVSLTATNYNGNNTKTEVGYITVTAIPAVLATTPGARCDSGAVTLQATSNLGTLKWYDAQTGGALLASGASFITPSITATTIYYVEAASGSCASLRTAVTATVNTTPSVVATVAGSRCGTGNVALQASASAGTLSWYNVASGGSVLATGTSFVTPAISATTTFYVSASQNGCPSPRTAVVATVNDVPSVTSTTPGSRCDSGTVNLSATAGGGTLNWYNVALGGTSLTTGSTFTTPNISATTAYYAEAVNGSCVSAR